MWTLSSDDGRVDLQMDGGERQPVRGIREGKHLLEIDILLATWSIVTLSLRDYKTEGSSASPTGRRKFVYIWKGNFTPCEWPDKASIRDGMSSASESSEDHVIDNDEPFDAGVLVPGQEIYLKEQYLGTYPIHLKNLIPPKPEHRSRVLDMEHVSSLVASFRDQDIGQLVILIGLVAADRDPSTLDKAGAGSVECLGGNHTREALLTLFEEGTLRYSHVQVRLYRNLSREAALSIGYAHNMITHEKRKVVTFMDKVRLMRDLLPPSKEQSAENIRIWKSALALIFKKKDGRHVQRQFSHHLLMARLPDHVWEVLLHAVQGIQITERFFKPLMRLRDQYVEDALLTLRNGVPEYKQKVKRLLSDVSKLRNGKQKKAPVEDDVNDGFEERVDDMEEQIRQEINEEVEENLESDLVAVLKKEIADLRAANDLLQSENILLKTERCGLQKKLEEAASQAKKRKSTEVSCQKEKQAKQMFTVKQRVWAKYNDGILYPAKIVEVMENGYKVRWVEDNVEGVLKEKEIKEYP